MAQDSCNRDVTWAPPIVWLPPAGARPDALEAPAGWRRTLGVTLARLTARRWWR